jgi:hypothetical protein
MALVLLTMGHQGPVGSTTTRLPRWLAGNVTKEILSLAAEAHQACRALVVGQQVIVPKNLEHPLMNSLIELLTSWLTLVEQ